MWYVYTKRSHFVRRPLTLALARIWLWSGPVLPPRAGSTIRTKLLTPEHRPSLSSGFLPVQTNTTLLRNRTKRTALRREQAEPGVCPRCCRNDLSDSVCSPMDSSLSCIFQHFLVCCCPLGSDSAVSGSGRRLIWFITTARRRAILKGQRSNDSMKPSVALYSSLKADYVPRIQYNAYTNIQLNTIEYVYFYTIEYMFSYTIEYLY